MSAAPTLAIDTSGPRLALALASGGQVLAIHVEDLARGHAERLFDALAVLLDEAGCVVGDIGRVAALSGPGSFTGLRVGLAAARGLALPRRLTVIGVPTLLALSLSRQGPHAIVLDARRGEAYIQHFSDTACPLSEPALTGLDAALAQAGADGPDSPLCDIGAVAVFAGACAPKDFPPVPLYIRPADAKPQTRGKVARQ
ncbi:tRNA (adenosine(37)-N6)-threonylcarbamoyltransferase complex dimerization subunit type 1 TsaB [Pelagibacterium montanilacus]|uniref:tRNA (adenosine(37)-N6)-threonylcarbamoyltransferase complex dimerization subunit type 1 TsaB n=1 Tax=Pelagibacterium montanilacus TaxID=2185280 RepID=UPI000F8D91B0|nr:tRNA (adenosine(37)-N6)-threonylcarbamoyltransferase complex dimerization subunit type 1 TsaB [Pelagibacterium montanilacus]